MGVRARLATLGLGVVAGGLGILGAGSTARPAAGVGGTYEVAAPLLSFEGGPVYACNAILTSLPPAGCGGVVVHGVDIGQVANVVRYWNGTLETPILHLVGTWDGRALTLTESPRRAVSPSSFPDPCIQPPGTGGQSDVPPRQLQVSNDQAVLEGLGIMVLETVTCGDTLGIGVAVADPSTVRYLESHYGKVGVSGWLRPVPSGA